MATTKSALNTRLQIILRDTDDQKWSANEKSEILDQAFADPAITKRVSDKTLTAATDVQDYTVPDTIDIVRHVKIADTSGIQYNVDNALWDQEGTNLFFQKYAPVAGTMELIGDKQYASTDSIPDKYANFILYVAAKKCYEVLANEFANGLLLSDISMPEIQSGITMYARMEQEERRKLGDIKNRKGYKI
jgi:hypothetical protein